MNLSELFRYETDLQALPAGQALFHEGDQGNMMYVIMSGTALITVNNRLVETAGAGAIVGEMAMLEEAKRSATVTAQSDCVLCPIDLMRFNFLVQQTPNFALHIMRVMTDRLRKTNELLRADG